MRKFLVSTLFVALSLTLGLAQDGSEPTVQLADSEEYGQHLVGPEGFSLYLYTEDEQGGESSACGESCERNWPPLVVEGEPLAGEGVDADLLGALEREDGSTQVTYNGWPLYTYARDTEPGQIRGAGLGNVFFLVSAEGESLTEEIETATEVDDETFAQLMEQGGGVFSSNCAVCHGAEGTGGIGPALAGNSRLSDTDFLVSRVINGFPEHGMPPFGHLTDEQIASVATFVRNSWSNDFGPVTPEEVSENR